MPPRTRLLLWIALSLAAVAAVGAAVVGLAQLDRDALPGRAAPLDWYWLGSGAAWACLTAIAWLLWTTPADAIKLPRPVSVWLIVLVALALRVPAVATNQPQLSDDLWRYLHDGATLAQGENPYQHAPAELLEAGALADQPARLVVAGRVNHPHLVTIYQPASQWFFALAWKLRIPSLDPLGDRTLRLMLCAVDVGVVALLLVGLGAVGRSPWWAVLYAWHPLAVTEVAHAGHQDVLGIAALLGALLLAYQNQSAKRAAAAGALLAVAVAVKPVVGPLALPIAALLVCDRRWRAFGAFAASGAAATVVLYLPFALMPGGLGRLIETGQTFVDTWAFNGPAHAGLASMLGSHTRASAAVLAILGALLVTCTVRGVGLIRTAGLYFLAALLLSSTAHPWYLLWALALVPLCFEPAAWVLGLTIVWSYAALLDPHYRLPAWLVWAEYAPVYLALAWWAARQLTAGRSARPRAVAGPAGR